MIATTAEILGLQGRPDLAEVLTRSVAKIQFRGYTTEYEGGTYHYRLRLDTPVILYASIEANLDAIQAALTVKLLSVFKNTGDRRLDEVVVGPLLEEPMTSTVRPAPDAEARRLWNPGMLRLFISHVATHKIAVSSLKSFLAYLGISAFVAHEDIEPTREWQDEIDLALRSMDAMAAMLTPEFHESKWTDQEIGVAIARGVPIIPVRLGLDPYGFIGKHQGLPGNLRQMKELSIALGGILARRPETGGVMRESLVRALESSSSYSTSMSASKALVDVHGFTDEQIGRIEASIEENSQVADAFGVRARLARYVADYRAALMAQEGAP